MMPERIHLAGTPQRPWYRAGSVHATGWGYLPDGAMLTSGALASALDGEPEQFIRQIGRLGGEFAAVRAGSDGTVVAVDRVRSIPLFYGRTHDGGWLISDDAHAAASELGSRVDDPLAAAELMLTSTCAGPSTLATGLLQVQAGEAVELTAEQPRSTRYFTYADGIPLDTDDDMLVEQGAAVLTEAFERMIASVRGLPIAIPLSGGRDSRLIAALLAKAGRTDAIAFSYGRAGNPESEVSRRVAARLGLRWHFVPYSPARWHEWGRSERYQRFRRAATGLSAIEHEQDWPAVLRLREDNHIPEGTVFIPGHAGDFLGGSHVPARAAPFESEPVEWIWSRYYYEWPANALPAEATFKLRERIARGIGGASTAASAFARHGWQERQAKMIANSVRVYEDHGCAWRLPFWSHPPALDFWGRVPVDLQRDTRLYRRVLRDLTGPTLDDEPIPARRSTLREAWARVADRELGRYGLWLGPRPLIRGLLSPLGEFVRVGEPNVASVVSALVKPWRHLPPQRASVNALLALSQLNDLTSGRPLTTRRGGTG